MSDKKIIPSKTIAGEMLLYFYLLQRKNITDLSYARLIFKLKLTQDTHIDGIEMQERNNSILNKEKFITYSDVDLLNALTYLRDSNLIVCEEVKDVSYSSHIDQLKITAHGFDIIEGIERGKEEKREFNITFNFNIKNDVTVESLLKAEFGSIFKASLL